MKTRKYNVLTGPYETMNRRGAFTVLKTFIKKHGVKITAIKRSYVAGMVRVRVEGLHTNGARFFTAIEDRRAVPEARGLDYTLEGISLSMVESELYPRACSCCGKGIREGFVLYDGERYACSEACLYVDGYTHDEYLQDAADDCAYWTNWELDAADGYAYTAAGVEVSL